MATEPEDSLTPAQRRQNQKQRAIDMFNDRSMSIPAIARKMKVSPTTVRRWFKQAGLKQAPYGSNQSDRSAKLQLDPLQEFQNPPRSDAQAREDAEIAKAEQAEAEQKRDDEVAKAAPSVGDAYQSFVASKGMALMKEGLESMPPPKNVREAEVLDGIIRRNLGLNDKNGNGGNGRLSIDVAVLSGQIKAPENAKIQIAVHEEQEKAKLKLASGSVVPEAEQLAADDSE